MRGPAWRRVCCATAMVMASSAVGMLSVDVHGAVAAAPNTWTSTVTPVEGRFFQMSALLPSGKVLVTGGGDPTGTALANAETYDPTTGKWTFVASMTTARVAGAAVVLQSGKVLVVGGGTNEGTGAVDTGEVYDPVGNTWTPVLNSMSSKRTGLPTAVLLPNGKVLVAGGKDAVGVPVASADLYDPADNMFHPAHAMGTARAEAASVLLPSGKVLVAGGTNASNQSETSAETYDPVANSWTPATNAMSSGRRLLSVVRLPSGRVLVAGGTSDLTHPVASTDIYDPATNSFAAAANMTTARGVFGMTLLSDGRVLADGGAVPPSSGGPFDLTSRSELYNPATNTWLSVSDIPVATAAFTQTLLPGGQVLLMGGISSLTIGGGGLPTAALFTPPGNPSAPGPASATAGNGSALVTFSPPASDGGLPILRYTISASTGQSATITNGNTNGTISGLRNGRPVSFRVTATTAYGSSPASAASPTVIPGPPVLSLSRVPKTLKLRSFLKGVKVKITPNKPCALQVSLLGSVSRAKISRAFNLTLASKSLRTSSRAQTVKLVPSKKLVGNPSKAKVELVIVATDAAGNRATTTKSISIRR
jgi:Kelch motif/Fibronectin type III domain